MSDKKNKWIWDKTKIVLKDPQEKEIILSSLNLNDETMNYIFKDIEEYVEKKGGKLE
jgi:hypothetical protein|tara:strand:- start:194 stop:364 length:171 start_codon:yes stop_codon:yes gene_type:complete